MRFVLCLLLLWFSLPVQSQTVIDTVEVYNGVLTKKRLVAAANGETVKELYYHPNNQVQVAYFLRQGKRVRWVSYTTDGAMEYEWTDPEIKRSQRAQYKGKVFGSTLALGALVLYGIRKRWGYAVLYYSVLLLVPFLLLLVFQQEVIASVPPVAGMALASMVFVLTPLLLGSSFYNLFNHSAIPKRVSLLGAVSSSLLVLYLLVTAAVAGAGIIG
ncbi:MAG: hypothetical protein M3Y12_13150 [Bacteroidota bacterium]|nr:hypothetical protein [Bacteroidota bacterium]